MTETVPVGSMRLYDNAVPDVPAGVYRVRSSLDITADGSTLEAPPAHEAFLQVDGPRFTLSPADVAAVHPPPGSIGAFGERLPHIALTRRTLPWERRFDDVTPWLVLLVVREDEATVLPPQPLRAAVGEDHFALLAAAGSIEGDGPPVSVLLATDAMTQSALLPMRRDAQLLAHVRQVNLADSELAMGDDDGWFAVVVANRLPTTAGAYRACLVSLECREWLLMASAVTPTPLVVLYQWAFEVGQGGLFEVLARQLSVGALELPGDRPPTMARVDHDGLAAASTYRGPLRATRQSPVHPGKPGDLGPEAAAELGRLLGAADGRFLQDVYGWHRDADLADLGAITAAARRQPPPSATAALRRMPANPRVPRAVQTPLASSVVLDDGTPQPGLAVHEGTPRPEVPQ